MISYLKDLFKKEVEKVIGEAPKAETPLLVDYGYGFKGRKLVDDRYVLEYNEVGVDLSTEGNFLWERGSRYYPDCIVESLEELDKVAKRCIANRGF